MRCWPPVFLWPDIWLVDSFCDILIASERRRPMGLHLYLGDITKMETDAIVNAANTDLKRAPGICEAIFAASDGKALAQACRKFGRCPVGYAVVNPKLRPSLQIYHPCGGTWLVRRRTPGKGFTRKLLSACAAKSAGLRLPERGISSDFFRRVPHPTPHLHSGCRRGNSGFSSVPQA